MNHCYGLNLIVRSG